MPWSRSYPNTFTGQVTNQVTKNHEEEFKVIYNLLNQLYSETTGHAHTGNGSDGKKLQYSDILNPPSSLPANGGNSNTVEGYSLAQILQNAVPVGVVCMWSGSIASIPANWHLCDGASGTVDLRDRFVIGAGGGYTKGATGGETSHVLTVDEMPSHTHSVQSGGGNGTVGVYSALATTNISVSTTSGMVNYTGSGVAHNNMPPYYALAYIQKIA